MYTADFSIKQFNSETKGRHYEVETNCGKKHKLVSVTTLLDKYKDKSALFAWRDSIGHDNAQLITTTAATRGTKTHTLVEKYLLHGTEPIPTEDDGYKCYANLMPLLPLITPIKIEEKTYWVNSDGQGFAGTTDMWASIDGSKLINRTTELPVSDGKISYIGDIKSWSKAKYPVASTREGTKYFPLIAYGMQLTAYAMAFNQRTNSEAALNKAFIFGSTNNCRAPFIYYFGSDAVNWYCDRIKELVYCFYNDTWFDWKKMEQNAYELDFVGTRCDIIK